MDMKDGEVYKMLCAADTVGVFQVESRAQMATLPRLKPTCFYDIVVEVALIRPGPIQGGAVHPFIRRKNDPKNNPPTPPHPLLENALHKTLGVPLFQEQLMQMAIDVAGFTPQESDELRRAMSSKRSMEKMYDIRERLYKGMAATASPGNSPTTCSTGWPRSPTTASRRAMRSASPISCTRARGSSATTRRRSARRCSTRSRWDSTRHSPLWTTRAGTG
jgi:DNA polymerase III alpha subunit